MIQCILEYLEEHGNGVPIDIPKLECYTPKQVNYHVRLCGENEAGYMTVLETGGGEVIGMSRLTWAGHNALDALRQNKTPLS